MPNHYRYTVLTFITDGYEHVHETHQKDPEAEYLLVTDDANIKSDTWTVVCDESLKGMSPFDKCFYIRYHCFQYCHSDICLRIDGSIWVKNSLKPLIDIFEKGRYDAGLLPHPLRDNFLDEYKVWEEKRHYPQAQADKCIASMREKGYNFNYRGMFQANISIQRRGALTDEIDQVTYDYLKELGAPGPIERLDQIPFSFIMNTRYSHLKILPLSEQVIGSKYLLWCFHNSDRPIHDLFSYDIMHADYKYMFNHRVKCLQMLTPWDYVRCEIHHVHVLLADMKSAMKYKLGKIRHGD